MAEIDASTRNRGHIKPTITPRIGLLDPGKVSVKLLEDIYAELRRYRNFCEERPFVEHRLDPKSKHRKKGVPEIAEHNCPAANCAPHKRRAMAASTVKQIHAILSGTFDAAVRWKWMYANPSRAAEKPKNDDWGMLVWHLDFDTKVLTVRRNCVVRGGEHIEKDTKTHQRRHISLDDSAYLFSYSVDHSKPVNPDGITQRYSSMAAGLGINRHALRHFRNGTDIRWRRYPDGRRPTWTRGWWYDDAPGLRGMGPRVRPPRHVSRFGGVRRRRRLTPLRAVRGRCWIRGILG